MRICLCGSTRFMEQFHLWNKELALAGHTVYSVATSTKGDYIPTEEEKETLDLVHLDKILNSDIILVINGKWSPYDHHGTILSEEARSALRTSQYFGASTKREIKWAKIQMKGIKYTSEHSSFVDLIMSGGINA